MTDKAEDKVNRFRLQPREVPWRTRMRGAFAHTRIERCVVGTDSTKSAFWFSRRDWIADAVLAAIPWSWLAFLLIWAMYYGPNAVVP